MNKKFITTQILIVVRSSNSHAAGNKTEKQAPVGGHACMLPANPSGKIIQTGNQLRAA